MRKILECLGMCLDIGKILLSLLMMLMPPILLGLLWLELAWWTSWTYATGCFAGLFLFVVISCLVFKENEDRERSETEGKNVLGDNV